jgi:uncharacterized protein involved in exopolysaccharide biosynthesis
VEQIDENTVRIKVGQSDENIVPANEQFIQTACEILQSQTILNQVIDELNLNTAWGKKYFNGVTLKTSETIVMLRQRIQLAPVKNASLISITAYSDDKNEAAQIANAVAESYRDYRIKNRKAEMAKLYSKMGTDRVDLISPGTQVVQITDPAEPGRAPVKPNKPLNIALGAIAGAFIASVLGAIMAFITWKITGAKSTPATAA